MTQSSRRAVLKSLMIAPVAAAPLVSGLNTAATGREGLAGRAAVPLAQIRIGRFEVTALNDGYADMPFGYFTGRAASEIERAAGEIHAAREGGVRLSFNQFLVRDGNQTILIDTGPAGRIGETGGLPAALAVLGVKAEDIDAVVLTHLHVDHISGATTDGRKAFPNAEIFADRRDVKYWTDSAKRASAPDFLHSSFDAAGELVRLYPKLNAIDGEREIANGLSIVDLTGHTPGHIGVRIADEGQSLIMVSDMLFHPAVHPFSADIGFVFEQDPEAARLMRQRFFPLAAGEGALIAATHMPFPGLGRIARDDDRLRWVTAEWAHGT